MNEVFERLNALVAVLSNQILWSDPVLYTLLAIGLLLTIASRFSQFRALTHGASIVAGRYDQPGAPGAITHFQALSAALSATVGVGNIGGTALAIALGGPGALLWMWVIGALGMALKMFEVTLSMLYRNTENPAEPKGGPMWVAYRGIGRMGPKWRRLAKPIGSLFCLTLLVSTVTGGNLFQAWNAGNVTQQFFGVPETVSGLVLMILVGAVILGGIRRIGVVAARIVPFMCALYLIAAILVLLINREQIPQLVLSIFQSAFSAQEAQGAFLAGGIGVAFSQGLRVAFFSNESGQGSSPIAHSAAITDEPVREGLVAGLEPFIDTIVVCTLTGLVILLSGVWNRPPDLSLEETPIFVQVEEGWTLEDTSLPSRPDRDWITGDQVSLVATWAGQGGNPVYQSLNGAVEAEGSRAVAQWSSLQSPQQPEARDPGLYIAYTGATLTAQAFDRSYQGLGKWLVSLAVWLFALSSMISWSYYGEQGVIFLMGKKAVLPFRILFCLLIPVASIAIRTPQDLNNLIGVGTGLMLWVNLPLTLLFSRQVLRSYRGYFARLRSGQD